MRTPASSPYDNVDKRIVGEKQTKFKLLFAILNNVWTKEIGFLINLVIW